LVAITYRYPERGNHPALRDLTLNIPARRTTAVVGPSGSGKTTVADLVIGLLRPTEGDVLVDGTPLNDIDLRQWRRRIGYVPQESFLFNDTVRANLLWGSESAITDEELMEALRIVRLEELIASLPRGLDTLVGERGVHMSGGERQRLALARALLRRPRLLILDEATSSLDYENEALIQRAVEALHGGMTVLLITHRLPIVRHADTIHVLDRGRLVESGNWNELMREGTRFAELSRAYQRTEGSPSSVALSVAEAPAERDAEVRIG
jgi:ATP-binding cassette subfamily C protein